MRMAITQAMSRAGVNEMTLAEFTACITALREAPTKEDIMSTDRELAQVKQNFGVLREQIVQMHAQQSDIMRHLSAIQGALKIEPPRRDDSEMTPGADTDNGARSQPAVVDTDNETVASSCLVADVLSRPQELLF